jgi:heme exporter protein A
MTAATPLFSRHIPRLVRGGRVLRENFSISLQAKSILHITGANGCGKTSLLRFIAKECLGSDISCAFIPAQANFLKMRENITENLRFWHADDAAIAAALDYFGLQALADEKPTKLSAGQRQRVNLCRLMLSDAKIWLIDEPLNSLDQKGAELFMAMLVKHLEDGGGAMIASHAPLAGADIFAFDDMTVEQAA